MEGSRQKKKMPLIPHTQKKVNGEGEIYGTVKRTREKKVAGPEE